MASVAVDQSMDASPAQLAWVEAHSQNHVRALDDEFVHAECEAAISLGYSAWDWETWSQDRYVHELAKQRF